MKVLSCLVLCFCCLVTSAFAGDDFDVQSLENIKFCDITVDYIDDIVKNFNIVTYDQKYLGRTSKKHVGLQAADLSDFLSKNRGVALTASYTDQNTAEHFIKSVLKKEAKRIVNWVNSAGDSRNILKLRYTASSVIGHGMRRSDEKLRELVDGIVILKKDKNCGFVILTSYPLMASF